MKVLIVGLGGVTKTFRHWPERVLALALARRGHTVWSIGTRDASRPPLVARHETIEGVEVFRVAAGYWPNPDLRHALTQGPRPDIIHLFHPRNVLAAQVSTWAQNHNIPTVYTWLGPFHDEYATPDREHPFEVEPTLHRLAFTRKQMMHILLRERRPRDAIRNYRLHWPLRMATALAPCSEFEATMMRQFGLTQPQQVVPLWIDVPFVRKTPRNLPALDIPRPWLLFVGQLTPRKGYDIAIQALPTIVHTHPTASLLIVSGINQAQREHTMKLAQQDGVENHVHILGYLPDEDLINLYRASDALLFPTRYEGFGLPLLEAMAAECPVIATDIPVVREVVQDGKNGILVPYGESEALAQATIRLLGKRGLRKRLVAGGQATLRERYPEERLIGLLESLYARCISCTSSSNEPRA
jgi:glycosyltransferase involved in cell wall biosynthesis